jgi:outer membrane protein assembly factor BamB
MWRDFAVANFSFGMVFWLPVSCRWWAPAIGHDPLLKAMQRVPFKSALPRYMYAINAATGLVLWQFTSGGSCLSGAAIAGGDLFWGSGYSNFGLGTPKSNRMSDVA